MQRLTTASKIGYRRTSQLFFRRNNTGLINNYRNVVRLSNPTENCFKMNSIRYKSYSRVPIGGTNKNASTKVATIEFDTWKGAGLMAIIAAGLYYYFRKEKKRINEEKIKQATQGYGKPAIGGPFDLIDANGEKFTQENLKKPNTISLIYFGFTHCPDICPDELDKLGIWLNTLKDGYKGYKLQPIFITCDPARDTPEVIKAYLQDFHPSIIGLTGTYEKVRSACKAFRVYFSTPENVKPGQDYLVDHSVFFYMMDSEGEYMDVLGMNNDEETGVLKIQKKIDEYIEEKKESKNESSKSKRWFS
ncbi:hypothetical protein TBLA_0G02850 [Henningerozyma blattae CBS 6284]|uniref:Thioredoxin domain-containing protein n=1 Tax=Henningerozyma blattae (strain ATCC 34711 / CBS 6284 / DSM 70876 / NBRC 10599 / NRRL Y-10934 / UCD 77-7) TaxID=1071380 RepID=I2H770_HENB6|nr:hypothetical protein TBLA_0G02850 [Tetrapisispora blattae CBS 6284]CCH62222.1 hypothetical protein TBLA_0G02850 [Tetrapisispora blattae CBS 6284]